MLSIYIDAKLNTLKRAVLNTENPVNCYAKMF